jgi:hypothetical protein
MVGRISQKNEIKNLKKKKINTLPTGPRGPRGGQNLTKNLKKKNLEKKSYYTAHRSPWSPWWAGSSTGPCGPRGGQNLKKKKKKKERTKKVNTLPTGTRGPHGGQALHWSPWFSWWAESHKKSEEKRSERLKV